MDTSPLPCPAFVVFCGLFGPPIYPPTAMSRVIQDWAEQRYTGYSDVRGKPAMRALNLWGYLRDGLVIFADEGDQYPGYKDSEVAERAGVHHTTVSR